MLFIENWIISFPVCEYNKSEKAYLGFREDREFILSARKLSPTLILLLKFALLSQLKIVIGSERDLVVSCVYDTILCHVPNTPFIYFVTYTDKGNFNSRAGDIQIALILSIVLYNSIPKLIILDAE